MAPTPAKRKIDRLVVNLVDRKDDGSDTGEVGKKYDQQQKKEKKTAVAIRLNIWDLPVDLLVGEILAGLHQADRVHFGATCKKNYSLINNNEKILRRLCKAIDQLPWVATFSLNGPALVFTKEFKLYNPLHHCGQPPYANFKIKFPSEKGFNQSRNTLIACKLGWLLFSWPNVASSTTTSSTSFLLFCHFNKRLIKLPDLKDGIDHAKREQYRVGSFSSCPSHGSCVYFLLTQNVVRGKVTISTLKQIRNGEWKTLVFDRLIHMIESVVYHDGLFYCVSSLNGRVAAYDHVHESWTMVISSSSLLGMHRSLSLRFFSYIIEFNGNLLLVRRGSSHSLNELDSVCRVFELCSSTKTWVHKTSLDGNAIFLGRYRCSSSFVVSSAPSDVANKIYFHGYINSRSYPMYYSLHTGQSYLCSSSSSYWSSAIPGNGMWIPPPEIHC